MSYTFLGNLSIVIGHLMIKMTCILNMRYLNVLLPLVCLDLADFQSKACQILFISNPCNHKICNPVLSWDQQLKMFLVFMSFLTLKIFDCRLGVACQKYMIDNFLTEKWHSSPLFLKGEGTQILRRVGTWKKDLAWGE